MWHNTIPMEQKPEELDLDQYVDILIAENHRLRWCLIGALLFAAGALVILVSAT